MKIGSIKGKAIIFTLLILLLPLLAIGSIVTIYYYGVIKDKTWDNSLAQAKTTSMLVSEYMDAARYDLERHSYRDILDESLLNNDTPALNDQAMLVLQEDRLYNAIFITDSSGQVLASYPGGAEANMTSDYRQFMFTTLRLGDTHVSDPLHTGNDSSPTVLIGTPVTENGSVIGGIYGAIDLNRLADSLYENQKSITGRYIYLVNGSGRVFVHNNKTYMNEMRNFVANPAVTSLLEGKEGVKEYRDPVEQRDKVGAYSHVKDYGWGVVVSRPLDIAYKPVYDSIKWLLAGILLLSLISVIVALTAANYITRPIFGMIGAVKELDVGETPAEKKMDSQLPYLRGDELGDLARSLKDMSDRINATSQSIIEERNRAEFYVDLMAHDITNMTQALLMSIELLMSSDKLTEEELMYARSAVASINSIAEVIDKVKLIQKVTNEKQDLIPLDVDQMLQECLASVQRPADKQVTIDYSPGKGRVINGLPQFKRAFCEIVDNSIKYSGPTVRIDVDVSEKTIDEGLWYVVWITDRGRGIPPEVRNGVFRGRSTREGISKGRGLGLFIARILVEKSCGKIRVEERIPGDYKQGTRFIIEVPAKGNACSVPEVSFE